MAPNGRRSSSSERESSLNRSQRLLNSKLIDSIDEESALESNGQSYPILPSSSMSSRFPLDSDTEAEESDALVTHSSSYTDDRRRGRPRRKHTLSMSTSNSMNGYGALRDSTRTVVLGAENGESRPLQRQESVLKVAGLIDDRAGEFEKYRVSDEALKKMSKGLRKFYEAQNEILDGFKEVDEILDNARAKAATGELTPLLTTSNSAKEDQMAASVKFAINLNFFVNVLLLVAKVAVVFISHSMSLIASTVDSAMDFLSTLIIFGTARYIEHKDWKSKYIYPTGKSRMEPLGVLVFSVFMISSFLQVFIESVQRILDKDLVEQPIGAIALGVMGATIVIKGLVWVACRAIKTTAVEALQQDAETDCIFNVFSIMFPFLGTLIHFKYMDAIGGAVLSLYIMVNWTKTLLENVRKLTGRRAPPHEHQRVAYLLTRFSPLVTAIQHLSMYHAGDAYVVEVDIVLPPNCSLTDAHNLGESCQYGLECLSGIERAFVHVDVSINEHSGHLDR
ncbi:cation diffusion facilitator family transporter [Sporobolomyces salmoneus]|uniref:cation diffusion facilitator family transporter n=1 Tax=Sporobolomyces salmoneus TaxID=183962 RepID=UPI003179524B